MDEIFFPMACEIIIKRDRSIAKGLIYDLLNYLYIFRDRGLTKSTAQGRINCNETPARIYTLDQRTVARFVRKRTRSHATSGVQKGRGERIHPYSLRGVVLFVCATMFNTVQERVASLFPSVSRHIESPRAVQKSRSRVSH